jgi:alkanesulfonate monooxygenase SsuD/methylene tetrahydromethanopterin reductase-like flavin-dependent oxidoreductase (luciferase family)
MRFAMRYDMRAPDFGAAPVELYAASLEQVSWADRVGFDTVYLAEHHGAEDGYCPAPMVQAAAMAAVSSRIRIHLSALLAVLHDPVRLAEDLAVLDLLSAGRIDVTLGLGYRPHEYRMFGVDQRRRVPILEATIRLLQQAWTGEPFEHRGEQVVVRPRPVQQPGPPLYIGGSAEASAYRAARLGDGYLPALDGLWEIYAAECARLGRPAGPRPPSKGPLFLHVTSDPERDWAVVAPHVLYTARSNAEWARERGVGATPYPAATSVEELRAHDRFQVLTPDECVDHFLAAPADTELVLQPLMGGLPPEHGWSSLELFESAVLPRLVAAGRGPANGAERSART